MNFIDLQAQYRAYQGEIDAAIAEVTASARFIGGPNIEALEERLATFVGVKHAVGVGSGTQALIIPLMAWGIGPGDEVITSPFTFIASAEVIALLGAKPVFVDIRADDFNLDVDQLEAAITPRTKAIMPVSLYGQCADMDAINAIARHHGIPVIEDACQSFGGLYKGRRSCGLAQAGATSFFPAKPLGAFGDGGMLFTDDATLAGKARMIKEHGQTARYQHGLLGLNGRLDALQAAVLRVKMDHFEDEIQARQKVAGVYQQGLTGIPGITLPMVHPDRMSVYAQFTIRVRERQAIQERLTAADIPTAVHYPAPLHRQPVFAHLGLAPGSFPVAEQAAGEVLSLPMHPFLDEADQQRIIAVIREAAD